MRAAPLVAFLVLLAPLALASHPALTVLSARLDPVFDPFEELGSRYELSLTVRNDGERSTHQIRVDELWIVFDLPYTRWAEDVEFEAGETKSFVARVEYPLLHSIPIPGPSWLCLSAGGWSSVLDYARCWSVWAGTGMPEGAYPENLPHPLFDGPPMGDTP